MIYTNDIGQQSMSILLFSNGKELVYDRGYHTMYFTKEKALLGERKFRRVDLYKFIKLAWDSKHIEDLP